MKQNFISKQLHGLLLVPAALAMLLPTRVMAQAKPKSIQDMFKTWHMSSSETGDTQDTYGKLIQGYYIPNGVRYKSGTEYLYVDDPVQMQIYLKENTHSYINRIPFIFYTNFSGVNYEEGKDIQCQIFDRSTNELSEIFYINNGDEYYFDNPNVEYRLTGNAHVFVYNANTGKWKNQWKELIANFDITDFDRITYSTTEGFYKPAEDYSHVSGDWTAAFSWDGTTATNKTDVTNWDMKRGAESIDPVYEISNGSYTFASQSWKMNLKTSTYYTTQLIVRSGKDNMITLEVGTKNIGNTYYQSKTIKSVGMDASSMGTVNAVGRVDSLFREANNGWMKIEATAANYNYDASSRTYGFKVTCKDASGNPQPFQIGAVRILESANTPGMFYTTSKDANNLMADPHNSWRDIDFGMQWDGVGYKFADEKKAPALSKSAVNKFSFFDRGSNLNCIVYANPYTVIGTKEMIGGIKHAHPVNVVTGVLADYDDSGKPTTRKCQELMLTDYDKSVEEPGKYANSNTFKNNYAFTADKVGYDRNFNTNYATICLPFSLTAEDLGKLGVTEAFEYTSQDVNNVYFKSITSTKADVPFMVKPIQGGAQLKSLSGRKVTKTPEAPTSGMIRTYKFQDIGSHPSRTRLTTSKRYWITPLFR